MTFLETNRLRLRNVSPKDAIQMVDYRNNERCSKYQRGQTKDYKDIVALIERNKDNALNIASPTMISVALRETDVMIGEIVVMPNEGTISLGYTFSYKVHRSGYAYEALSSLIEYLQILLYEKSIASSPVHLRSCTIDAQSSNLILRSCAFL